MQTMYTISSDFEWSDSEKMAEFLDENSQFVVIQEKNISKSKQTFT